MSEDTFKDQLAIEEKAEDLAKQAMDLGLIPSFTIRYYPDCWEFFLPNQTEPDFLTPEEAYFKLKKLLEGAGKS
ncbi:MAG: hypothetical protein F6J93_39165 [Oscillatoria sp. SIO1A7]|nr:hypothetical protein [Oscillatoria sp. SIO1A7]